MPLKVTTAARRDIRRIYRASVHDFGTRQAAACLARIDQALSLIEAQPRLARERSGLHHPVRIHPTGAHVIV